MASAMRAGSMQRHFRSLPDPRVVGRTRHLLSDIIVLAICAVIGDCDDWPDIAQFARKHAAWFQGFLRLPGGIPSHDTFERVFAALDARLFERCCVAWLTDAAELLGVKHIAIDGKTQRGSAGKTLGPLHLVSAWATAAQLTLGQVAVDGKSNEITAIPQLLALLNLRGALVTIDAIGCQKEIARKIVAGGGDFILVVKGNQERLQADVAETVDQALAGKIPEDKVALHTTQERGHGREEVRSCLIVKDVSKLRDQELWPDVQVVGKCSRTRTVKGETSTEVWYFIGSRQMNVRRYAETLRNHWGIENNLHWQLDVSFGEDASRIQNRNGAANFGFLRKLALSLLKRHPLKESIARKRKGAAVDTNFLQEILIGIPKEEKI